MSAIVKVGIIGAGRIGKLHAENITRLVPSVQVVGISDVMMNKEMEQWAHSLG
ncbi:MAG: Gfo/Idh/MocA family oxidoreductase, partial [Sphaerochaetaceae bacterium]